MKLKRREMLRMDDGNGRQSKGVQEQQNGQEEEKEEEEETGD